MPVGFTVQSATRQLHIYVMLHTTCLILNIIVHAEMLEVFVLNLNMINLYQAVII